MQTGTTTWRRPHRIVGLLLLTVVLTGGLLSTTSGTAHAASGHITVPSNYVYNPNTTHQRTLHDYCSYSPDEFPAPGKNANFRGPCARHDMCYQYHQKTQVGCDRQLWSHLTSECEYTYPWYDPRRAACKRTADVYFGVVLAHTIWP